MDTVPPFIKSSEDEESIYGRGSCDAKGIIAAQIFAAERLRAEGLNDVGLLFTVDEEAWQRGCAGGKQSPVGKECRYFINGEPTDNRLATGTKGSVRRSLRRRTRCAFGVSGAGESAIEKLLDILQEIRSLARGLKIVLWHHDVQHRSAQGGTRPNVICRQSTCGIANSARDRYRARQRDSWRSGRPRGGLRYPSGPQSRAMFSVPGFEECVVRFTTDIPYLSQWGKPLLLGPGSILDAHTDHERISKRDLNVIELYLKLAKNLIHETRFNWIRRDGPTGRRRCAQGR